MKHLSSGMLTTSMSYPVTPGAIWKTVHGFYVKAGLIATGKRATHHGLLVHSLRYYFRTQLTALGVNLEYAEFMMGYEGALYNVIKSKRPEFIRNTYRAAGLSIRQRSKTSRLELLKELVRGFVPDPERVLVKDAESEARRRVVAGNPVERRAQALWHVLKEKVLSDYILVAWVIIELNLDQATLAIFG